MRALIAALLTAAALFLAPGTAEAATCVNIPGEFNNVEQGHTRHHVEVDIFDNYDGVLVDAWTADGWNWRLKAYAGCDGQTSGTIVYKRDAGTEEAFRVHSKAWA